MCNVFDKYENKPKRGLLKQVVIKIPILAIIYWRFFKTKNIFRFENKFTNENVLCFEN